MLARPIRIQKEVGGNLIKLKIGKKLPYVLSI